MVTKEMVVKQINHRINPKNHLLSSHQEMMMFVVLHRLYKLYDEMCLDKEKTLSNDEFGNLLYSSDLSDLVDDDVSKILDIRHKYYEGELKPEKVPQ